MYVVYQRLAGCRDMSARRTQYFIMDGGLRTVLVRRHQHQEERSKHAICHWCDIGASKVSFILRRGWHHVSWEAWNRNFKVCSCKIYYGLQSNVLRRNEEEDFETLAQKRRMVRHDRNRLEVVCLVFLTFSWHISSYAEYYSVCGRSYS